MWLRLEGVKVGQGPQWEQAIKFALLPYETM